MVQRVTVSFHTGSMFQGQNADLSAVPVIIINWHPARRMGPMIKVSRAAAPVLTQTLR